ncbi:MAG TPA: alanine--tRNA ligase [Candidatus Methylacidiphilales bacterium]|nr:alanine--tRNA ligase [Candidatus Methylacidiphilales bacterium]
MSVMTSSEIRNSFLDFFREKSHAIVPSSSLLPDAPNLLFTNAGMNQFVPIFLGQAPCPYKPARAADTQKCIRAGGKHNDLEDVGFDTYHHTFFEMLGNWSFGDYFKKEAIEWAWELVAGRWNFPPSRLYATVYQPGPGDPAGFDQEAHDHWAAIFTKAGLDPAIHIVNGNKKDNFWMMGDTGPCGPCSELHVDLTPGPRDLDLERQKQGRALVNTGDARCIEIWNLVFIQFNANPDGSFADLPAKHVDTGMGFERVTSMIQGTRGLTDFSASGKISNYETDVFRPLFDEIEKITGKKYGSTLPSSAQNESEQEKIDVAFRVIADHIRTLSFSIADGIQPSNEGRGYVLRRILRRAVRYGRNLGLREPFLGKLVPVLGSTMGHIFPEMVNQTAVIQTTLKNEEESFFRTLERGIELFGEAAEGAIRNREKAVLESLSDDQKYRLYGAMRSGDFEEEWKIVCPEAEPVFRQNSVFPGDEAFKLYDTYGFPLDLTELMARERGLTVDVVAFNRLMNEQKARGKAAQKKEEITAIPDATEFVYDVYELDTNIRASGGSLNSWKGCFFVPIKTPFYAAMGGQVEDSGTVTIRGKTYDVTGVKKFATAIGHELNPREPDEARRPINSITLFGPATFSVDILRRRKIEAHHSGTHIMHWALRKVLGNTVSQKGSYVGPDRLRFDFSHGTQMTPEELAEVERLVNEKIADDVSVSWQNRPYAEVKGDPNILQFFGDKYGEEVRVVSIGDFSKELCGGTHVKHSSQIGFFKILHESAIAAGVRRIEAASGEALKLFVEEHLPKQEKQYAALRQRKPGLAALPAFSAGADPAAAWKEWEARETALRQAAGEIAQYEKDEAKRQEAAFQKRAAADAPLLIAAARTADDVPFLIHEIKEAPAAFLPVLADALKNRWQGVAVLAAAGEDRVALLASVSPAFTKKVQAGKIIQAIAPLIGGKGGGRPELAQGGGANPAGLGAALAKAEEIVRASS